MNIIRRGDLSSGGTGLGPVTLRAACLILSAAALLTVPACEPASESRTGGGSVIFAVEPIRTFGLPDSAALDALPEAQAIGAASLAGIGGIEVSSTGTVYVLDPIWRKVVAFSPAFTIGIAPALDSLVVLRYRVLKDFSGPRTELRFPLDLDWENRLEVFHRDGWLLGTLEDDPFPEIYGRRIYGNRDAGTLLVPVVQDFVALREYRLVALPRPLTGG